MVNFGVIGDMGTGGPNQYKVAKSLKRMINREKLSFVVGLGDNIYPNGCVSVDDPLFQTNFEDPYSILPNDRWYMCLGNHDYGYEKDNSQTQIDYTNSSYNHNKKWNLPNKWYTKKFEYCEIFFTLFVLSFLNSSFKNIYINSIRNNWIRF
mgnify:CR=1 FL=1